MAEKKKGIWKYIPDGIPCLIIVFGLFAFIGMQMGVPQMLNTIMKTAPNAATPGKLKSGRINGRSKPSSSFTTPNSTNSLPIAPVITQIAIK